MDGRGWQRPIDGRGRGRGAGAEPPLGDGDHDQDTQPGSVANRSPRLAMLSQTLLCGVPTVDRKCDPGDVASGRAAQPQYSRGDLLCRSEARHRGGSERSVQIQHDAPSRRLEALGARLEQQFPPSQIEETADRAYFAGEATFTATVELPDELVPAAITACDQLDALLDELDRWAADPEVQLLPAPPEVRAYLKRYLTQARAQLHEAAPPSRAVPPA